MGMAYRKLIGDGLPGRRCDRDPSGGADERPEAHGESYEQRHEEEAEQRSDEQVHHLSHSDVGTARWRGLAESLIKSLITPAPVALIPTRRGSSPRRAGRR